RPQPSACQGLSPCRNRPRRNFRVELVLERVARARGLSPRVKPGTSGAALRLGPLGELLVTPQDRAPVLVILDGHSAFDADSDPLLGLSGVAEQLGKKGHSGLPLPHRRRTGEKGCKECAAPGATLPPRPSGKRGRFDRCVVGSSFHSSTPHPVPPTHRNASEPALARPALLHSYVSPHGR